MPPVAAVYVKVSVFPIEPWLTVVGETVFVPDPLLDRVGWRATTRLTQSPMGLPPEAVALALMFPVAPGLTFARSDPSMVIRFDGPVAVDTTLYRSVYPLGAVIVPFHPNATSDRI